MIFLYPGLPCWNSASWNAVKHVRFDNFSSALEIVDLQFNCQFYVRNMATEQEMSAKVGDW